MLTYFSRLRLSAGLATASFLLWVAFVDSAAGASNSDEVPVLFPGQEKVLYLPIQGDSPSTEQVRQKEVPGIARFMRAHHLAEEPVLTAIDADEVYLQVEPLLIVEAREAACKETESVSVEELVAEAQVLFEDGDLEKARVALKRARDLAPCLPYRMSRTMAAELLVWSGLAHAQPQSEEALGFIRAGLSSDPLIAEHPKLSAESIARLRAVSDEMEFLPQVDLHLPQGEGTLWAHKNILLNGRRVVFDKLFLQLPPGIHFLQMVLPDGGLWGTFLKLEAGTTPDLADLARERFELKERYYQQVERVLSEGYADPAVLQGFKVYAVRLRKEQFFLAAITLEDGRPWITVRRYQVDHGIEVPEINALKTDDGYTASVPLVLSRPWTVDLALGYSSMSALQPGYSTSGAGLDLDLFFKLSKRLRAGLTSSVGGRLYRLRAAVEDEDDELKADFDLSLGAALQFVVPLGKRAQLVPELGYAAHLNPLRGIPMQCVESPDSATTFQCGFESTDPEESLIFNLRARASGPRVRAGLYLEPFGRGALTYRWMFRVGYSPLLMNMPEEADITLGWKAVSGNVDSEVKDATALIDADSQFWVLHQLDFSVGIFGTY